MTTCGSTVYLGDLPEHLKGEDLRKLLSVYGEIKSVNLRYGYGFVEFESPDDARDVVEIFSKQPFMGSSIKVEMAKTKTRQGSAETCETRVGRVRKGRKVSRMNTDIRYPVIVDNMNKSTCWQQLKDFGRIPGIEVAFGDIDKIHRGRGFLEYHSQEDADRAVQELNGRELNGNIVILSGCGPQKLLYKPYTSTHERRRSCSPVRSMRGRSMSSGQTARLRSPLSHGHDYDREARHEVYYYRSSYDHPSPPMRHQGYDSRDPPYDPVFWDYRQFRSMGDRSRALLWHNNDYGL
ncbi:hypothetical protein BXZ70DRAFT_918318 [Cristinia sonorae]|uniref:RRM domain-containing protein n=1 Tax=Cristinia sonorae TaxID=1940300 RepID=A0A8K0UW93_9AGAR|nr:hypothetical protein BXZ70DRAFT_918318 [Cristinia sonorae]